jgi:ribosome-associated heat shock protein Hsp15
MSNAAVHADVVRIDKWLWAARFFKTRSLATDAIDAGHVRRAAQGSMNGDRIKPALIVRVGDAFVVQRGDQLQEIVVLQTLERRGSATDAAALYRETDASIAARLKDRALRTAASAQPVLRGRPTKHDRRKLAALFAQNYPNHDGS